MKPKLPIQARGKVPHSSTNLDSLKLNVVVEELTCRSNLFDNAKETKVN